MTIGEECVKIGIKMWQTTVTEGVVSKVGDFFPTRKITGSV